MKNAAIRATREWVQNAVTYASSDPSYLANILPSNVVAAAWSKVFFAIDAPTVPPRFYVPEIGPCKRTGTGRPEAVASLISTAPEMRDFTVALQKEWAHGGLRMATPSVEKGPDGTGEYTGSEEITETWEEQRRYERRLLNVLPYADPVFWLWITPLY